MKKLLIIITLFVSSFFSFSFEALADTFSVTLNDSSFSYLNEDFYTFRSLVQEYAETNDNYYLIFYENDKYYVYFLSTENVKIEDMVFVNNTFRIYLSNGGSYTRFYYENNSLVVNGFGSGSVIRSLYDYSNNTFNYNYFLDSNFNVSYVSVRNNIFSLQYKNLNIEVSSSSFFPSLYDVYLDSLSSEDVHFAEKNILNNFYLIIIEKINYLSEIILNNYIFLSIIGIIILIFVFKLIFRRFL